MVRRKERRCRAGRPGEITRVGHIARQIGRLLEQNHPPDVTLPWNPARRRLPTHAAERGRI